MRTFIELLNTYKCVDELFNFKWKCVINWDRTLRTHIITSI